MLRLSKARSAVRADRARTARTCATFAAGLSCTTSSGSAAIHAATTNQLHSHSRHRLQVRIKMQARIVAAVETTACCACAPLAAGKMMVRHHPNRVRQQVGADRFKVLSGFSQPGLSAPGRDAPGFRRRFSCRAHGVMPSFARGVSDHAAPRGGLAPRRVAAAPPASWFKIVASCARSGTRRGISSLHMQPLTAASQAAVDVYDKAVNEVRFSNVRSGIFCVSHSVIQRESARSGLVGSCDSASETPEA